MTASRKVKYKGKTYPSVTALAEAFNINFTTLFSRLNRGLSVKEAIELKTKSVKQAIKLKGVSYSSIQEACKVYGISKGTISYRRSSGWTLEESFGLIKRKNVRKTTINGRVYIVRNKINNKVYIGLTIYNINKRLNNHIKLAKSGRALNNKFMKALLAIGPENFWIELLERTKSIKKLIALEKKYITDYDSIATGYNTSKGGQGTDWISGKSIKYDGVLYNSYSELSKAYGINIPRMHKCFEKDIPLAPPKTHANIPLTINGEKYRSISEAAKCFNIPIKTLYKRYKRGLKDNDLLTSKRRTGAIV